MASSITSEMTIFPSYFLKVSLSFKEPVDIVLRRRRAALDLDPARH
jgi:hypothetical protein